jgi:hypothetical protein
MRLIHHVHQFVGRCREIDSWLSLVDVTGFVGCFVIKLIHCFLQMITKFLTLKYAEIYILMTSQTKNYIYL